MDLNISLRRWSTLALMVLTLFACAMSTGVRAEEIYPNRPIKIVLPFSAGGSVDGMTRLLAQEMSKTLGQQVVVDNKTGAGGIIGADFVAKSSTDGYTMCMCTSGLFVLFRNLGMTLPIDPTKDLIPVTQLYTQDLFFVVKADSSIRSLSDLISRAKAKPDTVTYATSGVGGPLHLGAEALGQAAHVKMVHVPYKGESLMLPDLLGGQLDVAIVSGQFAAAQEKGGRVRVIASFGTSRNSAFPTVPTVSETYPNVTSFSWGGLFVPTGTPATVVEKLRAAAASAVEGSTGARMSEFGMQPTPKKGSELADFIRHESDRWGALIQKLGIKLETIQ